MSYVWWDLLNSSLCGRSVYRTIELVDGFDGRIIQTEVYFSMC